MEDQNPRLVSFEFAERIGRLLNWEVRKVFAGRTEPVPENQSESIQKIVETNTVVYPHPYLKKGQIVRVVAGPVEGVQGIFLSEMGNEKLVVSVEILPRSVSVAIDQSDIDTV